MKPQDLLIIVVVSAIILTLFYIVAGPTSDIRCSDNAYNCSDFSSFEEADRVYQFCGGVDNDVHNLDRNSDGVPCESLLQ